MLAPYFIDVIAWAVTISHSPGSEYLKAGIFRTVHVSWKEGIVIVIIELLCREVVRVL